MIHDLKLYSENFGRMKSGSKLREYRLYDEKRRLINIGDTIRFIKLPEKKDYLYADVVGIEVLKIGMIAINNILRRISKTDMALYNM